MELDFEDLFETQSAVKVKENKTTEQVKTIKKPVVQRKVISNSEQAPITSQGSQHTFVIREDLWQRLKTYNKKSGISLVNLINGAIENFLDGEN